MVRAGDDSRGRLRWQPADEPGAQPTLFSDPGERIRHPEFADLEFIHVRAKRIINEVPAAARVPFRYTINVYRGCSHACGYCQSGDTPILMADGRTKPLADVRPGDAIYGTVRRGRYRRYTLTEVFDHWSTIKPGYRVTLEDGTELIASGDHRFLTERGWKHVIGAWGGPLQRPHLTTNDALLGMGWFPEPPKPSDEYRRGYLCGMVRGEGHLGIQFRLALADREALERTCDYLAEYGIRATTFPFQPGTPTRKPLDAIRVSGRRNMATIGELIRWPTHPSDDWRQGFLAGIFDAEGSYSGGVLRITNKHPAIIGWISSCLRRLGFYFVVEPPRPNGCRAVRIPGGLPVHVRFFHTVDPAITRKRTIEGQTLRNKSNSLRVTSIEPLGMELPLYDITTGTGDFIAKGVVSHNCFARPSHTYLNLDAGRDFERVIVVKVNAVEALRAELAPRRWAGEHIAMGTNTDPYQRCEGRYRLTRGVIETLSAAGNPFSILTKSPLVLRDLDLLVEAASRTDLAVNFSIATLDSEVWRATEPGTPRPESRVEAVARLREAGIPSGVLVAPIIPGISDGPDQLEAVVKAVIDAGATSVTPIVLHLRPGVKEQFLPWLESHRPDLLDEYRRLYPRSYAPKATQERIGRLVVDLVSRHGGTRVSPGAARRVPAKGDQPKTAGDGVAQPLASQLDLF
ncbi:MAG: radical SAM protein [Actinomycetota bacterium]|nr:radical SAM protein [Actinomycetota bacterium]